MHGKINIIHNGKNNWTDKCLNLTSNLMHTFKDASKTSALHIL